MPQPSHREWGNFLHHVLEQASAQQRPVREIGREILQSLDYAEAIWPLWWPRFERIAHWVQAAPFWQPNSQQQVHHEAYGKWQFASIGGTFTLTAKADRLSVAAQSLQVADYKTGAPPDKAWQEAGMASQLPLTALIASANGFNALPQTPFNEVSLRYIKLGGPEGGALIDAYCPKETSPQAWLDTTRQRLQAQINQFDNPETPYTSLPHYRFRPRYNDYEHLARMAEWLE